MTTKRVPVLEAGKWLLLGAACLAIFVALYLKLFGAVESRKARATLAGLGCRLDDIPAGWREWTPDFGGAGVMIDARAASNIKETLEACRKVESIWKLNLANLEISTDSLDRLAQITDCRYLVVDGARLPDGWVERLATLHNLQWLDFAGVRLQSQDLAQFHLLANLRRIDASRTNVNDKTIAALAERDRLSSIIANETEVEGDFISAGRLPDRLVRLDLEKCGRLRQVGSKLSGCKSLQELRLRGASVADVDLRHLAKIRTLERLYLARTQITDAAFKDLDVLPALKQVDLDHCKVGVLARNWLASLPSLKFASLQSTGLREEEVKPLRRAGVEVLLKDE